MAAIASLPTVLPGTVDALRSMDRVLDDVDTGDVVGVEAAGVVLGQVDRLIARLQAVRLSAVAEADRCRAADATGATGTSAWLASRSKADAAAAARDVRLATALDDDLAVTRQALADGELSAEHARVIATAASQLPADLSPPERASIEERLVDVAQRVDPATLRKTARRALEAAQRSQAEVDAHEDKVLRSEEDAALARTRLTLHDNADGTVTGHFTVPTLAGQILKKVVQQIASPRRFAQQAAKQARAGGATTAAEVAEATWDAFRGEDLDWAQKYGRAFVELLEHLPTDHLAGKVNATILVTFDHDRLRASLGAAHLDTGHDLSAGETRRLACGAGIVAAVLGGGSQVLDLGRSQRFFTEAQRVALATRYDTCGAEGFDRPNAWCELHHEDPWASGGESNLDRAVPLWAHHHRRVHDPVYGHLVGTDGAGIKRVTFVRRS